jgi:hypothetical protein
MAFDEHSLIKQYTPMLVLYPEIPPGSTRIRNKDFLPSASDC